MIKKIIIIILALFSIVSFAQQIEVNGHIKDKQNEDFPFASVVFKSTTQDSKIFGTLADEYGKFRIEVPKDKYKIEISVVGIVPKTVEVDLSETLKSFDLGDIEIISEVSLEEVVVKGNKATFRMEVDKKTYNVSQDLVAKGGTLTDIMQNLPSVQVESEGNISIRGDQNVRILIDGKPSGLASSAELFSSIPASSIEKIEIITNPSSKYSAQGTAGIINIILKKGQKRRFSSILEIFTGNRFNIGVNGNFVKNYETGSWFTNIGIGYSEPKGLNNIFLQNENNSPEKSIQNSERIRKQYYNLLNIGGTKQINEKDNLSGAITYRIANSDNFNNIVYKDFYNSSNFIQLRRDEEENEKNNFVNGNVTFEHKFEKEGHQLSFILSGEYTKENEQASIISTEEFPNFQNLNRDNVFNIENSSRYILSTDYILPIKNNYKIELGYRSDWSSLKNNFSVERTSQGLSFTIPEFSNKTRYHEKVHAFYGLITKGFNKVGLKLGLRTEISDIDIESKKNDFKNFKNYIDWFPSLAFDYNFNEDDKLQFSISRRINRPSSWMIIPFSSFTDERNIYVGNSDVNPSYIVANEIAYIKKISNKISIYPTFYYRKTTNEMEFFVEKQQIMIGNSSQDFFVSTIANIGNYTAYGAEIGISYRLFNWWDMYGEINLNGFNQKGEFKGISFNGEGILVSGRYNSTFSFLKSLKIQLQNFFKGPIETGQYKRKGFYIMNIGLSNNIMKENATITFNINDVFNSNKRMVTTFGEDFIRDLELQYRVRQINFSFTYRFNQNKKNGNEGNQYDNYDIIN